jgi:hypothetical protein
MGLILAQTMPLGGTRTAQASETRRTPNQRGGIVLLIADGQIGWAVANDLIRRLGPMTVIAEAGENRLALFKRRARLLGPFHALGQLAAMLAQRILLRGTKKRRQEIVSALDLQLQPPKDCELHRVPSVNSPECRDLLTTIAPKVVAVFGTRLLQPNLLASVDAPFINCHPGINPKYRGIDPAYWALVERDVDNVGVTIHLVDEGVDTGPVLSQASSQFTVRDNIQTYQWRQLGDSLPLFAKALQDALGEKPEPISVDLPSKQYFAPTLWQYLWYGLTRGVW